MSALVERRRQLRKAPEKPRKCVGSVVWECPKVRVSGRGNPTEGGVF